MSLAQKKSQAIDPRDKDFSFNYYFLEGNKCKNLGDYEKALSYYTSALKVDASQPSVYYEIATVLLYSDDLDGAYQYAKKAVSMDKTNNLAYSDMLIYICNASNKLNEVIPLYKKMIKSNPYNFENYLDLARIYESEGNVKDAIKVLSSSEKYVGILDYIIVEKEGLYEKIGQISKGAAELEKLCNTSPSNLRYKTMLAEAYLRAQNKEMATKTYKEIESHHDINDGLVYYSIAEFHRMNDITYHKYFDYLEKSFSCDEETSLPYETQVSIVSQLIQASKKDDFAMARIRLILNKIEEKHPGEVEVLALMADMAMASNDYRAVQKNLMKITDNDKSSYEIWENLVSLDYYLGDYDNLYTHSKEASELFPNVLSIYQYYVVAAYIKRNFDEVITAVNDAYMLAFDNQEVQVDMLSMQGDAYNEKGMYHQADSVFELVLYKDRDYLAVLNNYSYNLAERNENLAKALELSSHMIELDAKEPMYLDTHAWVLFKNGKYDEALKYINMAIDSGKESQVYYEHKGDILFKSGKVDDAVEMWKKALDIQPDNEPLQNKINNRKLN